MKKWQAGALQYAVGVWRFAASCRRPLNSVLSEAYGTVQSHLSGVPRSLSDGVALELVSLCRPPCTTPPNALLLGCVKNRKKEPLRQPVFALSCPRSCKPIRKPMTTKRQPSKALRHHMATCVRSSFNMRAVSVHAPSCVLLVVSDKALLKLLPSSDRGLTWHWFVHREYGKRDLFLVSSGRASGRTSCASHCSCATVCVDQHMRDARCRLANTW